MMPTTTTRATMRQLEAQAADLKQQLARSKGLLRTAQLRGQPSRSEARERMQRAEAATEEAKQEINRLRLLLQSIADMPPHELGAHANLKASIRLARKGLK